MVSRSAAKAAGGGADSGEEVGVKLPICDWVQPDKNRVEVTTQAMRALGIGCNSLLC